jgi:hypothetical protein
MSHRDLTDTLYGSASHGLRALRPMVQDASLELVDGLLDRAGLQRKTTLGQHALWVGAGVLVGGVVALLLAPSSGKDLRKKIQRTARAASDRLEDAAESVSEGARHLADAAHGGSSEHDGYTGGRAGARRTPSPDA